MTELARRNAERAGSAAHVHFACADVLAYTPPAPSGLLIANPPYGKRLGSARDARALYGALGERLRASWRGFRVALLVPRELAPAQLGLPHARSFALYNGGIAVKLVVAQVR
jgi:23S rRNA G2445 N2-methylase RlmL